MKLQPLAEFPTSTRPGQPELPPECCARCKFWFLETAQPRGGDFPIAQCRRFPGTVVVLPVAMDPDQLAKLRIDPKTAGMFPPGAVPSQPQPIPTQIVKSADDWCGEFSARPFPGKCDV